jgi:hypothetical protein
MPDKRPRVHPTVALHRDIWAMLGEAKTEHDPALYLLLTKVQRVLWQYEATTSPTPEYVPCLACSTTGRVHKWNAAVGATIQVFCHYCQGAGETWNAHPKAANRHDIRGEM